MCQLQKYTLQGKTITVLKKNNLNENLGKCVM